MEAAKEKEEGWGEGGKTKKERGMKGWRDKGERETNLER